MSHVAPRSPLRLLPSFSLFSPPSPFLAFGFVDSASLAALCDVFLFVSDEGVPNVWQNVTAHRRDCPVHKPVTQSVIRGASRLEDATKRHVWAILPSRGLICETCVCLI